LPAPPRKRERGAPRRVDQADLQGNILCGYGNEYRHALYVFARVKDAAAGQALIGEWLERDRITNAVRWPREQPQSVRQRQRSKPEHTLNVAFTWQGLGALGVPADVLAEFPEEFRQGMGERAKALGDTGRSAPDEWDEGLRPGHHDMLVTVFARTGAAMDSCRDELLARIEGDSGLELAKAEAAELIGSPKEGEFGREHFGFADGLSQPTIADPKAGPHNRRGRGTPKRLRGWDKLAPGEFVLGYLDEDGVLPDAPRAPLGRSGSYMVVRKLHQHVDLFTNYLRLAAELSGEPEEELAAKMIGRYRDGRPVARPNAKGPKLLNAFRYRRDEKGEKCPAGAHIRRANPRDGLGFQGRLTKRHRIIRRGMPYGPPPEDPAQPDDEERGLMFVCYQASIKRQFEIVQSLWLNDGEALGLGSDKDFLVSTEEAGDSKLTIPRKKNAPILLAPQPSFVTTKGGGYFFAPGIGALRALRDGM
jgi:Dyp-type peroxidase family